MGLGATIINLLSEKWKVEKRNIKEEARKKMIMKLQFSDSQLTKRVSMITTQLDDDESNDKSLFSNSIYDYQKASFNFCFWVFN